MSFFGLLELREPLLQFHYCKPNPRPRSIIKCKPFSYVTLKGYNLYVKLITDEDSKDLAVKLVSHLKHGYKGEYLEYKAFSEIYGLTFHFDPSEDVVTINYDNYYDRIEDTVDKLKDAMDSKSRGIIIIIVKNLPTSMYYETKSKSLVSYSKMNIRTQFAKKSTIETYVGKGGYEVLLLNMATSIYAKAGGIPWKLAHPIIPMEGLIVGISFIRLRERKEERERIYYGSIEILDRYGEHLITEARLFKAPKEALKTKGLYVPYDQMYRILKDAIEKYGKPPMLIIHKSSPYVIDEELKAIHDIIQEYSDLQYSIMHLAVHIKGDTIYRLYDFGASDLSVNRGMALVDKFRQNNWRIILFTTGRLLKSSVRRKLGTPKPLELDVIENTGQLNAGTVAYQVLALTKLDWNTTEMEIRKPITLKYSKRAAKLAVYTLSREKETMKIGDIRDLM